MQNICYNCFHYAPEGRACPYCKYDPRENEGRYRIALKPGTILVNRYLIGRVLGQGGFGITYVALDNETKSRVAIKEYMPTEYASRDEGTVGLRLNDNSVQADFEYGKEQFLQEAKTLAAFVGNEHIIGIRDMFEANGTAYFAMEFAEGVNLKQYMEQRGGPLQVYEANRILLPIMEALQWVHSKGIVHRDIAPDNIMIRSDGKAKLIDFGAARYSTGEKSKSLDVILKHGFAPYEQYSRRGRQGPFTDVYALAATYYYAITGKVPPDAVDRMDEDTLLPPSAYGVRVRRETESVLLKALAVSSRNRYQTMAEFYMALLNSMPEPFDPDNKTVAAPISAPKQAVREKPVQQEKKIAPPPQKEKPVSAPQRQKVPNSVPGKKKSPIIVIAVILAVCILAGVLFSTGALKKRNPAVSSPSISSTAGKDSTAAVQKPAQTEPDAAPAVSTAEVRIGLVTDVGGIHDNSFNQTSWEGLQALAKEDPSFEVSYLESRTDADYRTNINAFIDDGYDLIICVGYMLADATREAAEANPDQKFAVIDDDYNADLPNVACLMFAQEQASYLVGLVAGSVTETKTVGYVQGMVSESLNKYGIGYIAGVLEACPDATVLQVNANSFGDLAGGAAIALEMIGQGADVIFQAAGGTGMGVIEACNEEGVWAIGVDFDQSGFAPDFVITSAMKRVDVASQDIARAVKDGSYTAGVRMYDLSNGGVDLAPTRDHIPADFLEAVEKAKAAVIAGEKVVPTMAFEVPAFTLG